MIIYVYSKCSTCQKALRFLEQRRFAFTRKEITETPPCLADLRKMLEYQDGNLKKLFNTSGDLYKQMELSKKLNELPLEKALDLLTQYGMLVKRPFILGDQFGLVGFNEKEWTKMRIFDGAG